MSNPFFTIVIPTRNRPELFELALKSVLGQDFQDFEVIVVNDGSDPEFLPAYKALEEKYAERTKFVYQIKRPNGHGQSYSMNTGALVGKGDYLGFLDDDDFWIDEQHLTRCHASISQSDKNIDGYYTNQVAYFSDQRKQEDNVWIEDLATKTAGMQADEDGSFEVGIKFLLSSAGFGHLNCSIVKRKLYLDIKGMDENIRYECDRDIYIRFIDAADGILYNPKVISQHHIPDPKKADNMSTLVSSFEKKIYQITVYEKAILLSQNKDIRNFCKLALSYIFKAISQELSKQKRSQDSASYAYKALALQYSIKWHAYCLFLSLKAIGG